jgi:tRNA(Ile)-lysidine synthase
MNLLQSFQQYIQQHHLFNPKDKLLLAVSGGVDSVVLCEWCKQAGYDFGIAHCNFQLRGEDSTRDELFVQQLAKKYDAVFYSISFDTAAIAAKEKKSIEAAARDLRYNWFEKLRAENGYSFIVTAHHADDNIETVLMNFFRGTGIKGLHGIPPRRNKIVRPLLFATKNELADFAAKNKLAFVTDYTNSENEFTRNYFRNELIPGVKKVFPAAAENILKNITRFGEAELLYQQAIALHKTKLLEQKGNEIHIPVLKLQKSTPLATIVYEIIRHYNFTAHQTEEVIALLQSESGKYVQSATHRVIKNRKWLIISPNQATEAQHILIEDEGVYQYAEGGLEVKKMFNVQFSILNNQLVAQLNSNDIKFPLLLRQWKPGDYFYPLGMQKKKKLSRFFTDQKLSVTQKEKVWVLESNKKILWVMGMRIDDRFKVTAATKNILHIEMRVL